MISTAVRISGSRTHDPVDTIGAVNRGSRALDPSRLACSRIAMSRRSLVWLKTHVKMTAALIVATTKTGKFTIKVVKLVPGPPP
jgi:hypothetical protein